MVACQLLTVNKFPLQVNLIIGGLLLFSSSAETSTTGTPASMIPHSFATLIAVNILSPETAH